MKLARCRPAGEGGRIPLALGLKSFCSADSFDKIPKAESVGSFYVSAMGWVARRVYLVLELKSTSGLNNRNHPIRISVPRQ